MIVNPVLEKKLLFRRKLEQSKFVSMVRKGKKKGPSVEVVELATSAKGVSKSARRRRNARSRLQAAAGSNLSFRQEGLGKELAAQFAGRDLGATSTQAGAMWLAKFLDPCHPEAGAVLGVPDEIAATVVSPSYRLVDVIDRNVQSLTANKIGEGTWSSTDLWNLVQVCDFSIGKVFTLRYQGRFDGTPTDFCGYVSSENVYPLDSPDASVRPTYAGVTYEFAGTITVNQGSLVAAQIDSPWSKEVGGGPLSSSDLEVWKMFNSAGQVDHGNLKRWLDNLTTLDPNSMSVPAREGAYYPVRNTNKFRFQKCTGANLSVPTRPDPPGVDRSSYFYFNPFLTAAVPLADVVANAALYPDAGRFAVFGPSETCDMMATVLWATGVSQQATFQRTIRFGLEKMVDSLSPFIAYSHPSPSYDKEALEAAIDVRTQMASAYPAEFNFLDKLWNTIKKIVKPIVNVVKPLLPIIKPILPHIPGMIGLAGGPMVGRTKLPENSVEEAMARAMDDWHIM